MSGYGLKVMAAVLGTGLIVPLVTLSPREGEAVAIVFPFWMQDAPLASHVWNAGGTVVSINGSVVIATEPNNQFFTELRSKGALIFLDARNLAALCGFDPNFSEGSRGDTVQTQSSE